MIQWTGAPTTDATTDATNSIAVTYTLTEGIDYLPEDDERSYETFMDGWRYRFDHWHMHLWFDDSIRRLVPVADRPRRIEEAGRSRRWTSGFR